MPRLPTVTAQKLLKAVYKLGFSTHHQTGSHIQLKHPDGKRTTVPYHAKKDIRKGTLRAIIRDLDITVEEFKNACKK
jgi:predicted RNA binding protein YcfA (HicA-like mRNA interferase family)